MEHDGDVDSVAFRSNGKTLATGTLASTGSTCLWDVATGKLLRTLSEHDSPVLSVVFSPDSQTLATGTGTGGIAAGTVHLWDVATGKLRGTLPEHDGDVDSVAFSPDGKTLATATDTGTIDGTGTDTGSTRLWEVATGVPRATLPAGDGSVHSAVFSPDGKILAIGAGTGFGRGSARFWDMATGKLLRTFPERDGSVFSVAFSPNGKTLATGTGYYSSTGTLASPSVNDFCGMWRLASCSGRSRNGMDRCSRWRSVRTARPSPPAPAPAPAPAPIRVSRVFLWDVATGKLLRTFPERDGSVFSVAFSPNGKTLATGTGYYSSTGTLASPSVTRLWDVATGKLLRTFPERDGSVLSVAFSPNGKTLATGTDPFAGPDTFADMGVTRLWDVATGKLLRTFPERDGSVFSVAFSPDGKTLATGTDTSTDATDTGTAHLWDVATGTLRTTLQQDGSVLSVAFSPDGKTLATGTLNGTTLLWDVELPDAREISASICEALHRNVTRDEQSRYLLGQEPNPVCPDHFAH